MKLLDARAIWTLAALCMGAFMVWLALRTPTPLPAAEPRAPTRVVLPGIPASAPDPAPALAELATSKMWGPRASRPGSAASAAAAAAEPAWFLAGVYGPAAQRVVVLRFEAQARPALQLQVGQRLPDGARIEAIEIDRVQVRPTAVPGERRPKRHWLPVNRGLPVPDN